MEAHGNAVDRLVLVCSSLIDDKRTTCDFVVEVIYDFVYTVAAT